MTSLSEGIPTRKGSGGETEVETRPMYIEEWLETLPYVDFERTTQLLVEVVRASNKVPMKASQRIELIGLYNRPYQYYIDSQVKVGAHHTLQSIETLQRQIQSLKHLAVSLAIACRMAIEAALNQKTLWMQSKPPLEAILTAINYFSHTLIFSFLEYAPPPKNVWRELNFLYEFAESINQQNSLVSEITDSKHKDTYTIAKAYKRIILASMADPHHLPFGAIWEVFGQLKSWVEMVEISDFAEIDKPQGHFVVDVKNDIAPIPYAKFNKKLAENRKLRLVDALKLQETVQKELNRVSSGQAVDSSITLSPYYAKSLLGHMARVWGLPPKRYFPREQTSGALKLTHGINSIYYFLNGENDFVAMPIVEEPEESEDIDVLANKRNDETTVLYRAEDWELVDQGAGGIAVMKNLKPKIPVRVGDLVGINRNSGTQPNTWAIGVIRWLMIRQNKIYKSGIQIIANDVKPVSVKQFGDRGYQRAFLMGDPDINKDISIITGHGMYEPEQTLELYLEGRQLKLSANELKEANSLFEHFAVTCH